MSTQLERRILNSTLELRAGSTGNKMLVGYAAVYNSDSEDLGGFTEQIAPGAFDEVLRSGAKSCVCCWQHDQSALLGRVSNGTLRLSSDSTGLRYECDVAQTSVGKDVLILAARQDITKSSFAFRVGSMPGDQCWYNAKGQEVPQWSGDAVRRVINLIVELADVSPVSTPAYMGSSVSARSLYLFPEGDPRATCGTNERTEAARLVAMAKLKLSVSKNAERVHSNAKHNLALRQIAQMRDQLL